MQAAERASFPTRRCDALAKGFFENRNVQSLEATLSSFQSVCMLSGMRMRSAFSKGRMRVMLNSVCIGFGFQKRDQPKQPVLENLRQPFPVKVGRHSCEKRLHRVFAPEPIVLNRARLKS